MCAYIVQVWEPGQERVTLGPFRSEEKADSRRSFFEQIALSNGIDVEVAVIELLNSHTTAHKVFDTVELMAGVKAR